MVTDHIGKAFFPSVAVWQIIGRIAFPIFAYCLVVGCLHTHNIKKYLLRLLIFAVIAQPVYVLNFYGSIELFYNLNILFTLFFGAFAVYGLMDIRRRWWMLLPCIAACLFLHIEYGTYGIILIVAFYVFRESRWFTAIVCTLLLAQPFFQAPFIMVRGVALGVQGFAVFAMPFICLRTDVKLKMNKYFFYAFYPAHILVIYIIARILK